MTTHPPSLSAITATRRRRASVRAELVRLGSRWLLKHRYRNGVTIEKTRRRVGAAARLVPKPPAGVQTLAVNASGVKADRISTPLSEGRHILFLHGGGFIIGA